MLPLLRHFMLHTGIINASNDADAPPVGSTAYRLRKRLAAARSIVEALEDDLDIEDAALQLAWAEVITLLVNDEPLGDVITLMQKLFSGSRLRKRKAFKATLSPQTMQRIEDALQLM